MKLEIERLRAERDNWRDRHAEISKHCDWKSEHIARLEASIDSDASYIGDQDERIAELEAANETSAMVRAFTIRSVTDFLWGAVKR